MSTFQSQFDRYEILMKIFGLVGFLFLILTSACKGLTCFSCLESGISGMVHVDTDTFLIANDLKSTGFSLERKPRLRVLALNKEKGILIKELPLQNSSSDPFQEPNDLESICVLPDRNKELLLAESGYYKGNFGRIFHIRLNKENGTWTTELISSFRPFPPPKDVSNYTTPKHEQVEGIGCIMTLEKQLIVVFGQRGGGNNPARLIWGTLNGLDEKNPAFTELGKAALSKVPSSFGDRGVADLYLKKEKDGQWRIWTIATDDFGDFGPFRSIIYSPGILSLEFDNQLRFNAIDPIIGWQINGSKVEAITAPAELIKGSAFSIGTDDEIYGGIWRPLFPLSNNPTP